MVTTQHHAQGLPHLAMQPLPLALLPLQLLHSQLHNLLLHQPQQALLASLAHKAWAQKSQVWA